VRRSASSAAPSRNQIGAVRRVVVLVLVGAALVHVITGIATTAGASGGQHWTLRPWRLLGASVLEVAALAWSVHLWSRILACFGGVQPGYRPLLRAWRASTLAKYLPGSVWSAASTVELAPRIGVSPVALPASFLLLATLNLAGALAVAALFGGAGGAEQLVLPAWLAASAVAAALVLVHPALVNATVRAGARVARRAAPTWNGSWVTGASLLLLFMATWIVYGAAFALFLSGLVSTAGTPWLQLAGMNALAFAAGFVVFLAPGGVGVREAALVALLAPTVAGSATRIALAATSRLWLVLTEAVGIGLVTVAARPARSFRPPLELLEPDEPQEDDAPPRPRTHRDAEVALLTDTRSALVEITAACAAARRSIRIAQLAFDADCVAVERGAATLLETIAAAARRGTTDGAPLDVRILLNGGLLLDTSPALRRAIAELGAGSSVEVRAVKAFPRIMHAKTLIVDDDDAFITGASFVNGYWDDARHIAAGAPDASAGTGERPLHDAAIRVRGSAASEISAWFDELWAEDRGTGGPGGEKDRKTEGPKDRTNEGDAGSACVSACAVQVLRTLPATSDHPSGRTEILDAYLDAIARARTCIYLESQYFSSRPIARAVRSALDANDGLEVILVLNQNPDVTAYRGWQDARLAECGLLEHPRVGAFALWSAVPSLHSAGRTEVTQVFVHSKVAVIDDRWATLGTANLDGASLHSYGDDFGSRLGRRVFGRFRNYDLNVALLDGMDGTPATGVAADLRRRLWARHLGVSAQVLAERPPDGWLPLWRARAAAHVSHLASGASPSPGGRALPYVQAAPHPRDQLGALGIDAAKLDLRFDPSWLDVRCNVGWMGKIVPERFRWWTQ
jgi:phosphatidylserine/phosphatidylglycerophosphate/cardiolipin synthase-like enzyme/uncharacterized membrane protein YbhN (UPF0104 family)